MVSCQSAVAENQPVNKHRMNQELSDFAARLRDSIIAGFDGGHFDDLAVELFGLQYRYNPDYRKLCDWKKMTPSKVCVLRGTTPSFAGRWTQIPFAPTNAFKQMELTCLRTGERAAVFHSSGTTEQKPSCHYHNAESL